MDREAASSIGRVPHGSIDEPGVIDFSANTNPRMPDGVREIYGDALATARSYPPEPPTAYREAAAGFVNCDPDQVIPTAGGMAAIRLAVALAVEPDAPVLLPAPSFGEYEREVRLHGGDPTFVDPSAILETSPAAYDLVVVCQPNNPTGRVYDPAALRSFAERCRAAETTLLVDEAFLGFTERSSVAGTNGVIVARSLTKLFGLPGLRAGFAVATGAQRAALTGARRPWNMGTPALAVGTYCFEQTGFIAETRERVVAERERLRDALDDQFGVHPSAAPFLLLDAADRDVGALVAETLERGIAVRDARSFRGLDSHIRVAVRLPEENDRLIEVLSHV